MGRPGGTGRLRHPDRGLRSRRSLLEPRTPDYPSGVPFRAIFLDVGETLVHVAPSFADLFVRVLGDEGHPRSRDDVLGASAHIYARFSEASKDGSLWTTSPERFRAFWTSVYDRMLDDLDVPNDGLAGTLYR